MENPRRFLPLLALLFGLVFLATGAQAEGWAPTRCFNFESGEAVLDDEEVSPEELRERAHRGEATAQYCWGVFKVLIDENDAWAWQWIADAADQGLSDAQGLMGEAFYLGKGAPGSLDLVSRMGEATKWLRTAADQGDPQAQGLLGQMFATGEGTLVEQDNGRAAMWMSLALEKRRHVIEADDLQSALEAMTPEEKARGRELAQRWKAERAARESQPSVSAGPTRSPQPASSPEGGR